MIFYFGEISYAQKSPSIVYRFCGGRPVGLFSLMYAAGIISTFLARWPARPNDTKIYIYIFASFSVKPASLICTLSSCASLHSSLCPCFL